MPRRDARTSEASARSFGGSNLRLIHAEVMGHLMPHGVFHQFGELLRTARRPFVRTLKDRYAVRHGERLEHAAHGQRPALIKPEQCVAWTDSGARQLFGARFVFDNNRNVLHTDTELIRNEVDSGHDQAFELFRLHVPLFYALDYG